MNRVDTYTNKTLSIRISTNGFCFCCYTATSPDDVQYHEYRADSSITLTANFENACNECQFIKENTFHEIKIIVATNDFTTIPFAYDAPDKYTDFYRSCFPHTPNDRIIIANKLTAQSITLLFPIEESLYACLNKLGDVSYYTPASIILGFLAKKPFKYDRYLLAYFQEGKSLLFSIAENKLQLANSFNSSDIHDQAYYLLSIWKEQGLSQIEDKLLLCGDYSVEDIAHILQRFIQHHERINPHKLFQPHLLNKIENIPFDLQALLLCE